MPTENFTEIAVACPECSRRGFPIEKCRTPVFRDAVRIPEKAIVGVVFGAECTSDRVENLLSLLREDRYKHVKLYRSAFSGQEYRMDYTEKCADDIATFQREHTERVAMTKGHVRYCADGTAAMVPFAAQKGINLHSRNPSQV